MEQTMKERVTASVKDFRLPRYADIPNVGLYMEQTVKYMNDFLAPLGDSMVTSAMISNYVKQKLIVPPVRKQYTREQIARLFIITIAKSVLSLENVQRVLDADIGFDMQQKYDYVAAEFENLLFYVFDLKDVADNLMPAGDVGVDVIRNLILTAANKIYLDKCLADMFAMGKM